jgi:sec-independent protein translocase protein TatB
MEILGIGPSELFFIIIIALIVLGPKDMQKAGKTVGRWLNNLVRSDGWKAFQQTSKEIRTLPTKLMREANLEVAEMDKEVRRAMDVREKPSASSPSRKSFPINEPVNTIQSPTVKTPEPDTEQHG